MDNNAQLSGGGSNKPGGTCQDEAPASSVEPVRRRLQQAQWNRLLMYSEFSRFAHRNLLVITEFPKYWYSRRKLLF